MRIDVLGKRLLSINEGPTEDVKSVAKARDWRIAGQGSMYIPDLTRDPNRTFKKMRDLRHIYLQGAYISEGVDLYPLYTIGAGYTLEIDEDEGANGEAAKADTEDFLNGINVYDITWQMMVDAITVRDGLAEIVMGKGSMETKPVNVIPRPAECFEFETNTKGAITRYIQRNALNGETLATQIPLEKPFVLHYQFMSRPDSPYGISLIERVIHDIKRDTRVIEATANGICLHGTPKWQIALNKNRPDAAKASDADWTAFKKEFENINALDNFPTEGDIEMIMHDTAGVPNVQQYSDVSLTRVIAGMGIPGELVGLRQGTTDATAVTRVGAFFKKIKSCQRDVEQMWNIVIDMRTGVPGLVKMVLNDTDPQDFAKMATAISQLRTGTDPDAVCPAEWCREQLGIPEDERSDEEKPQKQANPFDMQNYGSTSDDPMADQKLASEKEMTAAAHELAEAVQIDKRLSKIERQLVDSEGTWITINGAHILLKDGESPAQGFERTTGSKLEGEGGSGGKGKISTTLSSKDGTPKIARIEYGENETVSKTVDGKNIPIKSISGNKESVTVETGEMTIPMGRNPDQTIPGTMAKYNDGHLDFSRDSYDYHIALSPDSNAALKSEISRLPDKFKPKPATYNKEGLAFHEGLRGT